MARRRAWYVLMVLVVTVLAASINRQIIFLIVEPLKAEMALSDAQIGLLTGLAPGILAGAGALLLGWLTDRLPRHLLLGVCVLFWSAATAMLGVSFTFIGFMIGVLALALGETALTPVANSLMPDLFAGKQRIRANLIYAMAGGVAFGLGTAAGGTLLGWVQATMEALPARLQGLSYWRVSFLYVALLGLPVALLVFSIGRVARQRYGEQMLGEQAREAYATLAGYARRNWAAAGGLYMAIACTAFAGLAVMSWTPAYIMRLYGVGVAEVGFALGLTTVVSSLGGVGLAWFVINGLIDRYGKLAPRHLYQVSMLLVMVPALLQLQASSPTQAYVLYGAQLLLANLGGALSTTMLQDISPADMRGRLFGFSTLTVTLISSVSPLVVGLISDGFPNEPRGLLWAILLVVIPALLVAAAVIGYTNRQYLTTVRALAVQ